jgi:glycerol-3-phosphate dehydrogenase
VGGKWTTFRAFAEQVTDRILNRLGQNRKVSTENLAFGGGIQYPTSEMDRQAWLHTLNLKSGFDVDRLEVLFKRYGTRAMEFVDHLIEHGDSSLRGHWNYSREEIEFMALHEKILHLEDLILRRTDVAKMGELNSALLEEFAAILGAQLDWSERECKQEVERTLRVLEERHGVKL